MLNEILFSHRRREHFHLLINYFTIVVQANPRIYCSLTLINFIRTETKSELRRHKSILLFLNIEYFTMKILESAV